MFQLRQKITTEQEGVVESHLATDNSYSKKLSLGFLQTPPLQEVFPNEVLEAIFHLHRSLASMTLAKLSVHSHS